MPSWLGRDDRGNVIDVWSSDGGTTGADGEQGQPGDAGLKGDKGDTGATGPQGETGPTGAAGPQGETGPAGPQGEQGPAGNDGAPGAAGPAGEQGPQGDPGPEGQVGPKGDTGDPGPQGDPGATGPKGDTGDTGPQGPKGDTGDTGPAGADGAGGEAFPIGSVFLSVVATNPSTLLGYGTWSAFGAGRMLVGNDGGTFGTDEATGGAATHTHAGHSDHAALTHSGATVGNHTDVLNHVHPMMRFPTATGGSTGFTVDTSMTGTPATANDTGNPTANGVAAQVHTVGQASQHAAQIHSGHDSPSHLPPFVVVHMWKRTA